MTNIDPELIAALAEGRLPSEEAAAAEARIDADPVARADLAAQRQALAALRTAPAPRLDDLERVRLRRAVAAELDVVRPTPAPARRRFTMPWAGLAVAAAALVLVIAAAPLLSLLTTSAGDSFDAAATITEAPPATESAAAEAATPAQEEVAAPPAAAATTVVAATTPAEEFTTAADDPSLAALAVIPDLGVIDPATLGDEIRSRLAAEEKPWILLRDADATAGGPDEEAARRALACAEQVLDLRAEATEVAAVAVGTLNGEAVEVYAVVSGDPPETEILALDAATCRLAFPLP